MINRVVLVGRITKDPELRKSNSGNSICSFTVAIDNIRKNQDGSKGTSFIPCVAFNTQADNMSKFIKKGSLIGVEGRIVQRTYVRQDNSKASVIEVNCDSVQFLEPKGSSASNADTPTFDDEPRVNDNQQNENLDTLDLPDDDLPF